MEITGFVRRTACLSAISLCIAFASLSSAGSASEKTADVAPLLHTVMKVSERTEAQPQAAADADQTSRTRTAFVKTVDFYLRDGALIFGKLVSEDKNKVTVEELKGSEILVNTYSRRDIEPRTLQTKSIPESTFYLDMADYFAGRTWDFKDDPDDFIHAIRCYERAKRLITGNSRLGIERLQEVDAKIVNLQADRQVWEREIASRAKLKELEFTSEFESRFKELEGQVTSSSETLKESIAKLDKVITDMKESRQGIEQTIPAMEQDIRRQLGILADQIESNRRAIDPFYVGTRYRTPYGRYGRYGY